MPKPKLSNEILNTIKSYINMLDVREAPYILSKLKDEVAELTQKARSKAKRLNLTECRFCGCYFDTNQLKKLHKEIITEGTCVFWDDEYGDNDRFADIIDTVVYVKCPYCHKEHVISRTELSRTNEKGRR